MSLLKINTLTRPGLFYTEAWNYTSNQARRHESCDWLWYSQMGTPTYSQHVVPSTTEIFQGSTVNSIPLHTGGLSYKPAIASHKSALLPPSGDNIKVTCEKVKYQRKCTLPLFLKKRKKRKKNIPKVPSGDNQSLLQLLLHSSFCRYLLSFLRTTWVVKDAQTTRDDDFPMLIMIMFTILSLRYETWIKFQVFKAMLSLYAIRNNNLSCLDSCLLIIK